MNDETILIYASLYSQIVSQEITESQISLASLLLLFYASSLHFPDEFQYIWKPKLTLSALLYILGQYSIILLLITQSIQNISPTSVYSLGVCNGLGILGGALEICGYIGVQGLISLRTYSICRGYRPMAVALSITFFAPMALQLYLLTIPECFDTAVSIALKITVLIIIRNTVNIFLDGFALIGVIHQVWSIWKLKRSLGLQNNGKDLVTSLLHQGLHRFLFVLFITTTAVILQMVQPVGLVDDIFITFQNVISTIMMCEFTIALRRRNTNRSIPNQSDLDLPTLSLPSQDDQVQTHQSILERIHESLVAEMAERSDPAIIDNPREIELDNVHVQDVNPAVAF